MFWNFYVVKSLKISKNSATIEAKVKNKHIFVMLRILEKN